MLCVTFDFIFLLSSSLTFLLRSFARFVEYILVLLFMRVHLFVDGIDGRNNPVVFVVGGESGGDGVRNAYDGRYGTKTS